MSTPFESEFKPADHASPSDSSLPLPASSDMALTQPTRLGATAFTTPGWYQEPGKPGVLRYWNGASWEDWRKPLVEAPSVDQGQKSTLVAYLLLIFLGSTGAHRFYLGRRGTAAAMLIMWLIGVVTAIFVVGIFLLAVVGIWSFIDLFLIPGIVRQASLRAVRPRY